MSGGPDQFAVDVLLIEDDPGDAAMVTQTFALTNKDCRCHVVADGAAGLRFLRRDGEFTEAPPPQLILLDLGLPALSGLDVLAAIKSDPKLMLIPVVVLSGSQHPDDIQRSYRLHANAYVVKPADFDGLAEAIRKISSTFLGLVRAPG